MDDDAGRAATTGADQKKKRKGRGRSRPAPADRARRILSELRELSRDLAHEQGATGGPLPIDELSLTLSVDLNKKGHARDKARASQLVDAMRGRVGEAIKGASAFHQGHIYCFYSDAAESPYSSPPSLVDVFAGYAPNGKPEWISFPNLCLQRKEPRVDRLYADKPEVLAIVQLASGLTQGLLPGFGRDSLAYRMLGQVSFGLVPSDLNMSSRSAERVALTLQIVETTHGTGSQRLRLNILGMLPDAITTAAAEADARSSAEGFRRVLRATRSKVDGLGRRRHLAAKQGRPLDTSREVEQLLTRLRNDVLRVFKTRAYRTQHAETRHRSGDRPTGSALNDARSAGDGRLFIDTKRQTVVVIGRKGRAHIFTEEDGRHVTSLQLDPGEVERKTDKQRWQPLARNRAQAFRSLLDRLAARE